MAGAREPLSPLLAWRLVVSTFSGIAIELAKLPASIPAKRPTSGGMATPRRSSHTRLSQK